ncbi:hypothetical protein HSX10_17485 [Winogradskyella undariae]|uniref:tetratricopeptide repeat protein n=1 Tax=Winogradskyella undariae TaxID=1285465 RepID=UPI00156BABB9|nr:hypothetical protein [Winogradskyella undariae]NRR93370.1 hypothetical protein [Winogradskyella undariae]
MGIFDFLKPKKNGIDINTFNSKQYQTEITALAQTLYFENDHNYKIVKAKLGKQGLDDNQSNVIIENLKKINSKMVNEFQADLDSGKISEIKIQPNPEHKKGNVDKDQVDKYIGFGAYQMERGDLDNALELFNKAIELDDKATLAYANKGTLFAKKGDNIKSVEFYNKALEFEPNHIQILENKMNSMYEIMATVGEEKFIDSVKDVLNADKKSPNALIYIIQYHIKQNDRELALKNLKHLFSDYYSEQIAIQLLLQIFNSITDKEKAFIEFDKLESGLSNDAKYQMNYCKALYLKGIRNFEEAIELFKSLNKQQEFSWNYYQIGIIKNIQNKTDESIEYLKKTFELEKDLKQDAKRYSELQNLWSNPEFIKITE